MEKYFIIEETVSVTYFHKVLAETEEEARNKFYDGEDVEYNFADAYFGDDASLEIIEKKDW